MLLRKLGFRAAFWAMLLSGGVVAVAIVQFIALPVPAHAAASGMLIVSSGTTTADQVQYLSYGQYSQYKGWVNWPTMNTGCGGSAADYKKFSWQPSISHHPGVTNNTKEGNLFNDVGDCNDIFVNAGTNVPSANGNPGPWADISKFDGWGMYSSAPHNLGGTAQVNHSSTLLNSCNFINGVSGAATPIWGTGSEDPTNWATNMYPGTDTKGYGLWSGGTTLYRRDFTLTADEVTAITNGGELHIQMSVDDWAAIYLNGAPVLTVTNNSWSQPATIQDVQLDSSLLDLNGNNTLAIQMADKAIWDPQDPDVFDANARGEGLCYGLTIQNITDSGGGGSSSDCPGFPGYADVSVDLPGIAPNNNNPVPAYGPHNSTIAQDVPGDYEVTSMPHDEWGQNVTSVDSDVGVRQASSTFHLDYTSYVNTYPYDTHTPTVNYEQFYNETTWTANGPAVQGAAVCDPAAPMESGNYCYYGPTYPRDHSIYTDTGTGCAANNYGFGADGTGTCYSSRSAKVAPLLGYAYQSNNDTVEKTQTGGSTPAPQMTACFPRKFQITSASPNASWTPDLEDPTGASFNTDVTVLFTLPNFQPGFNLPLRKPARVNLGTYTTNNFVRGADGSFQSQASSNFNPQNGSTVGVTIGDVPSPSGSATGSFSTQASNSAPPVEAGDEACYTFRINARSGDVDPDGNILSSSGNTTGSACGSNAYNAPYVKVFGNDVWSGGGFADSNGVCAANPGRIETLVKSGDALPSGSSTQFAAMAIGAINGFASAGLRSSSPTGKAGLSFANTVGNYGGNSGLNTFCLPDYFSLAPTGQPESADTDVHWGNVPTGDHPYGGNLTIKIDPNTQITGKTTLFVNGNVYIRPNGDGNDTGSITLGSAGSVDTMPSLYIVARNIYIDHRITSLAGVYVAQPQTNGSDGVISTCADSNGDRQEFADCENQLTVTGSFVAKRVNLERTYASLRTSIGGEWPSTSNPAGCDENSDSAQYNPQLPANDRRTQTNYVCAAELFNFNPATYLGIPGLNPTHIAQPDKFDYITSLPPIL